MSIFSKVNNINCIHSNHLFSSPLCKEQSLFKRVANIAFHILTLGIPLAIYEREKIQSIIHHAVSWCYSHITSRPTIENLRKIAINSILQDKGIHPYSNLGQEALEFAKKKLEEHPKIIPTKFSAGFYGPEKTKQPINPAIAFLTTLYWEVAFKNFKDLMKENQNDPWNNQEVINAADACMKIAYAISNLTLDDLQLFTDRLSSKGENRTYAKALTQQDSYQYRTFYYCTEAYHWLRGEIACSVVDPWNKNEGNLFYPRAPISAAHSNLFYQAGTIQNSWNCLYNEYCDRVRCHVSEEDLQLADTRHFRWTKKDTGVEAFFRVPDTLPT